MKDVLFSHGLARYRVLKLIKNTQKFGPRISLLFLWFIVLRQPRLLSVIPLRHSHAQYNDDDDAGSATIFTIKQESGWKAYSYIRVFILEGLRRKQLRSTGSLDTVQRNSRRKRERAKTTQKKRERWQKTEQTRNDSCLVPSRRTLASASRHTPFNASRCVDANIVKKTSGKKDWEEKKPTRVNFSFRGKKCDFLPPVTQREPTDAAKCLSRLHGGKTRLCRANKGNS